MRLAHHLGGRHVPASHLAQVLVDALKQPSRVEIACAPGASPGDRLLSPSLAHEEYDRTLPVGAECAMAPSYVCDSGRRATEREQRAYLQEVADAAMAMGIVAQVHPYVPRVDAWLSVADA